MTTSTEIETGATACPICKAIPDRESGRCRCPRIPAHHVPIPSLSSTLVSQAESLFESYLAARLVRARRTLTDAKVAMLRDPRNRSKVEALRAAEVEAEKLQAQLLDQSRRVAAAREQQERRVSRADDRECPNCGERHRSDTSVCVCGYNFLAPDQNLIAEPFLTAEEVAALRGKPLRRNREAFDRTVYILVNIEHACQPGDLEDLVDARMDIAEPKLSSLLGNALADANEQTQYGRGQKLDVVKIQNQVDLAYLFDDGLDRLPQGPNIRVFQNLVVCEGNDGRTVSVFYVNPGLNSSHTGLPIRTSQNGVMVSIWRRRVKPFGSQEFFRAPSASNPLTTASMDRARRLPFF